MTIRFSIDRWAAWAPGLHDRSAWQAWLAAAAPSALPPASIEAPALSELPAMLRRRLEPLGRMALQAGYWAWEAATGPVIFASRYGEIGRSVALLRQVAEGEMMSPTGFSMSVHNAIGALHSIARGASTAYTAVAAGSETVEAAFTEAVSLLADGEDSVSLVYYDEALPELYAPFVERAEFSRAWACQLRRAQGAGLSLSATLANAKAEPPPSAWSADLAALRFLISDDNRHERVVGRRAWQWRRHA